MRKVQYLTALFFASTLVVIGCATPGPATHARSGRTAGASAETELREQLERVVRQLAVDAETMEHQQREIKALTEWIERFTSDPREMLTQLRSENAHLKKQLKNAKLWLGKYRQKFGDNGGPRGAPGVVKTVKGNLVVLSVGSDDGVRNGDTYQIRRGSSYVGQITITTVYKDQSVGTFVSEFKGPGAPPQAGDAAEAKNY